MSGGNVAAAIGGRSKPQRALDFSTNGSGLLARGIDGNRGLTVIREPLLIKPGKLLPILAQRPFDSVLLTAMPQLLMRSVEKNRGPGLKEFTVARLNESASAEGDHAAELQVGCHVKQGSSFGTAEFRLTRVAKYCGNRLLFASLDARIEVDELPALAPS